MLGLVQSIQASLWLVARNVINLVRLFLIREHFKLDRKVKLVRLY